MSAILRTHQTTAITMLRSSLARGSRRPMLQLATGAGKTVIAAEIIRMARAKGNRCLFVVDALSLIDQTVQAFYAQGLGGIGVIQGNHPMTDWSKPIQIASVQTLQRRKMPEAGLVIVDEAHSQNEWLKATMVSPEWERVPFIGLSATPWSKGLGKIYDDLIVPVTMRELIAAGYLSTFRVFAPSHPDLSGVKTVAGDYHEGQLGDVMSGDVLVADVVQTWDRLGQGRPTFAFCVDRAHAKKVQARFVEAGIGCGYIDAYTERTERDQIRKQLEAGEISVVANVGCLTKGVDWKIGCIILARPTKSEMLYVQMVGRGLRVNDGMEDCVILDHSDNTLRMGFVTDIQHDAMCTAARGERKKVEKAVPLPKECPSCAFLKPPKVRECPSCGFVPQLRSEIEEEDGALVEVSKAAPKANKKDWSVKISFIGQLRGYARATGKSEGWIAHKYREYTGVWPNDPRVKQAKAIECGHEVASWIRSQNIRYAKSMERQHASAY